MAVTSTITRRTIDGVRHAVVSIAETALATATESEIPDVPRAGTIVSYRATLTGGAGATINPRIGLAAAFALNSQNHLGTNNTTAAHIHDQSEIDYVLPAGQSLFIRSNPNAGADNAVSTEILIRAGR